MSSLYNGIFSALLIPYNDDYSVNVDALCEHIHDLFSQGCQGAVLFGTTGEAPSFSLDEKKRVLKAVIEKGVDPKRLMVGVGHW